MNKRELTEYFMPVEGSNVESYRITHDKTRQQVYVQKVWVDDDGSDDLITISFKQLDEFIEILHDARGY